jgi:hypothetical protein
VNYERLTHTYLYRHHSRVAGADVCDLVVVGQEAEMNEETVTDRPVIAKVMRMCKSKRAYDTEKQANRVIRSMWASITDLRIGEMHSYQCPVCCKWHVGHDRKTTFNQLAES